MTVDITQEALRLAEHCFAENLSLAFIGGSRAFGSHRLSSDIDIFVLLEHTDRVNERAFAVALRKLHQRQRLVFDHCGEVFDCQTLSTLLQFTELIVEAQPIIQQAACYRGNCELSIFRKGDVVFNFLADPKIHVHDRTGLLPELELRARHYLERWPMKRAQHEKRQLSLPEDSPQSCLSDLWRSRRCSDAEWMDTPLGVGLKRWFRDGLTQRIENLSGKAFRPKQQLTDSQSCPIATVSSENYCGYASQCLACLPNDSALRKSTS